VYQVALVVLAVAAGAAAVLVNRWLFPLYSLNRDDSVYVATARLIEHGSVTLPRSADAFRPWASAVVGDRIVLKYTPPWPALLAAGDLLTGSMRAALAVSAAATVVLVAALATEVLRDRTAGVVAGVLTVASPVFIVQSGTYLPYLPELAMALGGALLLLTGVRRGSTVRVVAAGAVLGVAAWARPFDALLIGLPFVVLAVVERVRARRRGEGGWGWPGTLLRLVAGAVPPAVAVMVYDAVVMGGPLRLPYTATGPQDGFGFGRRGVFPWSTVEFTPADGVTGLADNLRWLPSWTAGGIVLVLVAAWGFLRTRGPARWPVAALAVVVPLGYLPFWGPYAMSSLWQGLQLFGYFYHLPVLVPLAVFGASGLVALARRARGAPRPVVPRAVLGAVIAAMVALTVLAVPDKVAANAAVRDDLRGVQRFVEAQHVGRALLFLPRRGDVGFFSTTAFLENSPSLRQPVLYAAERSAAEDLALAARYPDRALYRLSEDLAPEQMTGGRLTMERLHVDTGPALPLRVRLTSPADGTVAVAYLYDGVTQRTRRLDGVPAAGRSDEVGWTVAAPGAAAPGEDAVRLPAGRTSGVIAVGLAVRAADGTERRWEERIPYRLVDGGTQVQVMRPGVRWSRGPGPGAPWVQATAGSPVADAG
jgi:4-amino-4-deoxy-L-arabinose transferase-like glycosyltransferase